MIEIPRPPTGHSAVQFAAVDAVVANLRREMVARIAGGRDADTVVTELRAAAIGTSTAISSVRIFYTPALQTRTSFSKPLNHNDKSLTACFMRTLFIAHVELDLVEGLPLIGAAGLGESCANRGENK